MNMLEKDIIHNQAEQKTMPDHHANPERMDRTAPPILSPGVAPGIAPGVNPGAPRPSSPSKCARLRALIASPRLEFLLEAHNGLSAQIVEEAGFPGIWASGLTLAAQFGVRDNNEASWTQIVDMLEFMADATQIPILLDGDTGHGNFNNVRRLVRKLEQRGIAGVCIEDKLFPKTNSFLAEGRQRLAEVDEFRGKIAAAKDTQADPDFCVVARCEALIAGLPMAEALRRAEAYRQAGADALLIHSKLPRPDQVLEFAHEWAGRAPLILVPTTYHGTPVETFRRAGISIAIWANHLLRGAATAMQEVARTVRTEESLVNVEARIAPLSEIFRRQGAAELEAAERRYAPPDRPHTRAIILAASRGEGLASLTEGRPKVMLPIAGRPLLQRLREEFQRQGVHDLTVVAGYKAETIDVPGVHVTINPDFHDTGELASLATAAAAGRFTDDMVVAYGDLLLRGYILRDLLDATAEIAVVVDSAWPPGGRSGTPDFAYCNAADDRALWAQEIHLMEVRSGGERAAAHGRWIGLMRVQGAGRRWLEEALASLQARPDGRRLHLAALLNEVLAAGHPIRVLYIHGHWLDVNALEDLELAARFAQDSRTA
jgi:phosphoenolpyruvate phosphomutase